MGRETTGKTPLLHGCVAVAALMERMGKRQIREDPGLGHPTEG
jgi:hypothetical protein